MKNIPNIITIIRIFLSITFLFIKPYSITFYIIYILCGISDGADGYISRRTNTTSKLGSSLDTGADIIMVVILSVVLVPIIKFPLEIIIWIVLIFIIRIIGILIAFYKYHKFVILHTYSNKLTGLSLFFAIIILKSINHLLVMSLVCIIASLASIEEIVIHSTKKDLDRDIKGIFFK
ncbi:putative phosphatidylglycerophosphate synthase [Clostridium bornimense]|uniref:Phosphatidylglycerophosphate synthase n=1 Tax=Clostridium bornimense TaxID=1216932 RepID=W6RY42_9CLOT|nr:CDP-alcohol phosphatidyltransferase family protein [Clostridium bornimense]CDM69378.1 putative phosphatidylglycerophosphate synthase [Clostridium bornimense]